MISMFFPACGHMIKPVRTQLNIKVFIRNKSINAHEFYSVAIPSIGHSLESPNPVGQSIEEREEHDAWRGRQLCCARLSQWWSMLENILQLPEPCSEPDTFSLLRAPCDQGRSCPASPVGARQQGTSQAKARKRAWWREPFRDVHSGQQTQHWGLWLHSQTL